MNRLIEQLQPYPFQKMDQLLADLEPAAMPAIALSIGEPKHPAPAFVKQVLIDQLGQLSTYPSSKGLLELRQTIAQWLESRFQLKQIDAETEVLPVSGTREGIFSFIQAVIDRQQQSLVVMPNPFYQIYEGATILAGAEPYLINCSAENHYLGDFSQVPESVWHRTQLLIICSPGNPTGVVYDIEQLKQLIALSDQYNFTIASDECYSEIWYQQPPAGLLQACAELGRDDYHNCVVFHSLSKRSNLPGLRSGFVAGDAKILQQYLKYRTYHGAAMPVQNQLASIAAWQDESHVVANREAYQAKFDFFQQQLAGRLNLKKPQAGFYYWLEVDNDEAFARHLYQHGHIKVLAGRYLSRPFQGENPGENHVRMALVADMQQCEQAVERLLKII